MSERPFPKVRIHYHRLPDRDEVYEQLLVLDAPEVKVTYLPRYTAGALRVGDETILEEGAPILWFTFPDSWHDIGRFHRADGTFTGLYANVITPVAFEPDRWETTDLLLDLWLPRAGTPRVLDEEEFEHALAEGWLDPETAARARDELLSLEEAYRAGSWPPAIVRTFDLDELP